MQKKSEKKSEKNIFDINEEIFDDEFFSPTLPITNLSRRINPHIKKINVDEEFEAKESNLNKDFDPFFNNDNQNFSTNSYSSHSFFTSTSQEGQSEPKMESFEKNVFTSNKDGKKIGESKAKYENTSKGIRKEAHERKINDKTFKYVKENKLNSNEEVEHRVYKGITGEDVNEFESEFDMYRKFEIDRYDWALYFDASWNRYEKKQNA